jgi:23S rRNA pseudouridine2605 synthase
MAQSYFQKFVPKKKNSAVKEEFKQKKRKAKKERAAAIDERFEEKRRIKAAAREAALNAPVSADISTAKPGNKLNAVENKMHKAAQQKMPANIINVPTVIKAGPKDKIVFAEMPLNKFMAHCGVCSRRDAVTLIKEGK